MSDKQSHPELDPIFEKLVSDAWEAAIGDLVRDKPKKARAIMRALDCALNPWMEAREVKRDGLYWARAWRGGPAKPAFVEHGIARWQATGEAIVLYSWQRFRERWSPKAPR